MNIEIKFEIGNKVGIKPLADSKPVYGVVKSVWLTTRGIQYEIRYFWNGEAKDVYFWPDELEVNGGPIK